MYATKKQKLSRTRSLKRTRSIPRPLSFKLSKNILRDKQKVTLKYHSHNTITSGVAGTFAHTFMANGLYDPDVSGIGHQPRGYDEMATLYGKYVVTSCKIMCRFRNASTTSRVIPFIITTDHTVLGSGTHDGLEHSGCKAGIKQLLPKKTSTEEGSDTQDTLWASVDIARWKSSSNLFDDDTLQASISTVPAEQIYFQVGGVSDNAMSLVVDVDMEFTAYMLEPKQPG